jgi:MFS family permease
LPAARSFADSSSPKPPSARWRLPAGLAAFRHRDYRILWSAQAGSLTGNWMQSLAQSWLVLTMTGSPFHLALINVCQFGPALLFGLPAGVLADRYAKRSVMLVTQAISGVLTGILALLVLLGSIQLWQIYAIALGVGIASTFSNPARQAFVVDVVGREDLVNAVALNAALFNASRVVGPAIAGVLLAQVGAAICFMVNAAAYIPVVIALAALHARGNPEPDSNELSPWRRLQAGLAYVRKTPEISGPIVTIGIIGIFGMNFSVWMPLLAVRLGSGAEGFGWLMSALGVGSLAGALTVAFYGRSLGPRALLVAPVVFAAAEVTLAGLAAMRGPLALVLPLATVMGLAFSVTMAMSNTTIQSLVPNALRGRVSSIYMTVFMGSVPLGALIAGTTSSLLGMPASVAIGGGVVLVSGLVAAVSGGLGRRPALAAERGLPAAGAVPPRAGSGGDD